MRAAAFHASLHLDASEVVSAEERCPVCLAGGPRRAVLELQDAPAIHLLACPRCRACSASHMPRPEVLERFYGQYYGRAAQKLTCPSGARFAAHIAALTVLPPPGRTLRVLDFGGGDGTLARAAAVRLLARRPGGSAVVDLVDYADPAPGAAPGVEVRGHRSLTDVEGPFDLVIASAILEHVPALHEVLGTLLRLAGPGGCFYARTPYAVPMARLYPGLDLTFPGHVHDLGCSFWNRVPAIFGVDARVVASQPSMIETTCRSHPGRTLAALVLKAPARVEGWLSPRGRQDRWWNLVGGWEVMLRVRRA